VPVVYAAPLTLVRGFLARTPADAVPPSPWLGIQGAPDVAKLPLVCPPTKLCAATQEEVRGVRVLAVAPGSPAQVGGLRAGDLIDLVDGQATETPERLQELIAAHAVGEVVRARVVTGDKRREVAVSLRAAP
jgi:S1-C subfamily serine protease